MLPDARLAVIEEAQHGIWLEGNDSATRLRVLLRDFVGGLR